MAPEKETVAEEAAPPITENFAELLEESLGSERGFEGRVVKGTIVDVDNEEVLIDVGLKSEGRVPLKEFITPGQEPDLNVGDNGFFFRNPWLLKKNPSPKRRHPLSPKISPNSWKNPSAPNVASKAAWSRAPSLTSITKKC